MQHDREFLINEVKRRNIRALHIGNICAVPLPRVSDFLLQKPLMDETARRVEAAIIDILDVLVTVEKVIGCKVDLGDTAGFHRVAETIRIARTLNSSKKLFPEFASASMSAK